LGLFSSESREIFDEILRYLAKPIAEGTIGEANNAKDREKILDSEQDKPKTQVNSSVHDKK
jgi:hypothetical protein